MYSTFASTATDWLTATAAIIAAIATSVAAWIAARSAKGSNRAIEASLRGAEANERVASTMKAQWEADRHAEAERQRSRRSSLLTALHTECTALHAIAASSDPDRYSRVPQGLPIWQEHRSTIIGESKTLGDALTLIEQQLRVIQGHLPNVIREGTPDFTGRLANHNAETAINEAFSSIEQLSKHAINEIDRLLSAV